MEDIISRWSLGQVISQHCLTEDPLIKYISLELPLYEGYVNKLCDLWVYIYSLVPLGLEL